MPKKYILLDNAVIAKQKNEAAHERKYPNRAADQARRYPNDPHVRPRGLSAFKVAPNGMVELEIEDVDLKHYDQDDQGRATDGASLEDEQ